MNRSLKAFAAAVIAVGTLLLAATGGSAFAQAAPSTITSHVQETAPYPPPPSCGGSGGILDMDYNLVVHTNTRPDGRLMVHSTTAGSFVAHPFVGTVTTGHFVISQSQTVVGTTFTQRVMVMTNGHNAAGGHEAFHYVADITVDLITGAVATDIIQVNCP
jgi:hypothetical protein